MDVEITKDVKNELFHRRELEVIVKGFNATLNREEITSLLVSKLGIEKENFVLDRIDQVFGEKKAVCNAKVYENTDYMKKYEPKFKLERGKPKEGEKKAEPAEVKEEERVEEKVEEKKPEEKKEETKEEVKEEKEEPKEETPQQEESK